MPQPRLKAGWHLLTADNGDIIVTAMAGGEQRITRPHPAIRGLLRRLAKGESLAEPASWLPDLEAGEAPVKLAQWLDELAGLGILDREGREPSAAWQARYGGQMAFFSTIGVPHDTGLKAQERLSGKTVALLGLDRQNAWLAYHLAVAGIGRLVLAASGKVSEAEAAQLPLWQAEDVGRPKVEAFGAAISRLNPLVSTEARQMQWQGGQEVAGTLDGADLALVDLGHRGLWDPQGLDRDVHLACFQRRVPTYLIQSGPVRVQWGPLLAPGEGPCYACLSAKLMIPEAQRLADRQRWLNDGDPLAGGFPPMIAEAVALALPELLLYLAGLLGADQLQRTTFFHTLGRQLQTVTLGPDAACDWCGVGTPAFADRSRHYARLDVRPMAFADKSYPSDPAEATEQVGRWLDHAKAPAPTMPRGIVAPHIEPRLGQISYGKAYGAFPQGQFPRRVIILATSHNPQSRVIAVSHKPFQTPWGLLKVDRTAIERLAKASGGDPYADEALFGYEHAIEFPAIFIEEARRRAGGPQTEVVPVLCGSLMPAMYHQLYPTQLPEVEGFVGALRELIAENPEGTCVIASIDLSHMGPRYGDPRPLNPDEIHKIETFDQQVLGHLANGSAKGYWETVAGVGNGTRICGLTPLYLMAEALPDCRSERWHYELALDAGSQSHIGHAAMLLH